MVDKAVGKDVDDLSRALHAPSDFHQLRAQENFGIAVAYWMDRKTIDIRV